MSFAAIEETDDTVYVQCQLDRGNESQVAWMPIDVAKERMPVKYRTDGEWSRGWIVAKVYGKPRSGSVLNRHDRWRRKNTHTLQKKR